MLEYLRNVQLDPSSEQSPRSHWSPSEQSLTIRQLGGRDLLRTLTLTNEKCRRDCKINCLLKHWWLPRALLACRSNLIEYGVWLQRPALVSDLILDAQASLTRLFAIEARKDLHTLNSCELAYPDGHRNAAHLRSDQTIRRRPRRQCAIRCPYSRTGRG